MTNQLVMVLIILVLMGILGIAIVSHQEASFGSKGTFVPNVIAGALGNQYRKNYSRLCGFFPASTYLWYCAPI